MIKKTPLTDEEIAEKCKPVSKTIDLLSGETTEIKTAVWDMWKKDKIDPNTLSRVQIQDYVDEAKRKLYVEPLKNEKSDDYYSHLINK